MAMKAAYEAKEKVMPLYEKLNFKLEARPDEIYILLLV